MEKNTRNTDHRNTIGSSTISAWEPYLLPCSDARCKYGLTLKKPGVSMADQSPKMNSKGAETEQFSYFQPMAFLEACQKCYPTPTGPLHVKMFSPVDCVRACPGCAITRPASNWARNCGKSPASGMAYHHRWGICANPPVRLPPTRRTLVRLGENGERRAGPCQGFNGRYGWGVWPEGAHSAWAERARMRVAAWNDYSAKGFDFQRLLAGCDTMVF